MPRQVGSITAALDVPAEAIEMLQGAGWSRADLLLNSRSSPQSWLAGSRRGASPEVSRHNIRERVAFVWLRIDIQSDSDPSARDISVAAVENGAVRVLAPSS